MTRGALASRGCKECAAAPTRQPRHQGEPSHGQPKRPPLATADAARRDGIYRHRLPVRVMHWINVVCLTILLDERPQHLQRPSGALLGPRLDVSASRGSRSRGDEHAARPGRLDAHRRPPSSTTTGVLGVLEESTADPTARASRAGRRFPAPQWLAMARHWHFFFAWLFVINGVAYVLYTIFSRHLTQDLVPTRDELTQHRPLDRRPRASSGTRPATRPTRYNVLQSLTYLIVIFGLLPLVVLAGLAMSPRLDARLHRLGRPARRRGSRRARCTSSPPLGLLLFVARPRRSRCSIAGVWNEMRSMITGWYRCREDRRDEGGAAMSTKTSP